MENVYLWVAAVCGFLFIYAAIFFITRYTDFKQELWYINMEIQRCDEDERCFWKKKKQKLIVSLIPFVRYE